MTDSTKEYLDSLFSDFERWQKDTWEEWSAKHPCRYEVQYDLHIAPWWPLISEIWFLWDNPRPDSNAATTGHGMRPAKRFGICMLIMRAP